MLIDSGGNRREISTEENRLLRHVNMKKYPNVESFLTNPSGGQSVPMYLGKNCGEVNVTVTDEGRLFLQTLPSSSVAYGLFVARGQLLGLTLGDDFETRVGYHDHSPVARAKAEQFFTDVPIEMPRTNSIRTGVEHEYLSFEEYSSTRETEHLSPWVYSTVNHTLGAGYGSAMELPIAVDDSPRLRDARMDVVHYSPLSLLCLEVKVSVESAVRDGRLREQAPGYRRSLESRVRDRQLDVITDVLIVPGGGERGLFRQTTSADGTAFRELCVDMRTAFITANALWCLLMQDLLDSRGALSLATAIEILRNDQIVGLTSAGFINALGEVITP